jgi:hypothetical protein
MICDVCGQLVEAIVRYDTVPFIDGRNYDIVCHLCASVPVSWEYKHDQLIYYGYLDHNRLATVDMLVKYGWSQQEAVCSLNAIKRLVKNMQHNVYPNGKYFIFNKLYGLNIELCDK